MIGYVPPVLSVSVLMSDARRCRFFAPYLSSWCPFFPKYPFSYSTIYYARSKTWCSRRLPAASPSKQNVRLLRGDCFPLFSTVTKALVWQVFVWPSPQQVTTSISKNNQKSSSTVYTGPTSLLQLHLH